MHVLYITPYVPSPVRVRAYELLRALRRQGVQITLLCVGDEGEADALRSWGIDVHAVAVDGSDRAYALATGVLRGQPLQAAYGVPRVLQQRLAHLLASHRFDLVHVEHLRAAALVPFVPQLPVVYDAVDCISLLLDRTRQHGSTWPTRALAAVERERTRTFEGWVCSTARIVTATSGEDAAALQQLAPHAAIHVVPNGVDTDRFAPPSAVQRERDVIVISGKMSYHANVAAVERLVEGIMPRVWQQRPQAQVWIVGQAPPRAVRRYAVDPRITVTGRVPDVGTYLQQATVAVSPLRYGVGVQNKVLEAMATATPVVTDRQCLAALGAVPDQDLLVAGDDAAFADAIMRVLGDETLAQRVGAAGRAYVERAHRWESSAAQLLDGYRSALALPAHGTAPQRPPALLMEQG